MPRHYKYTKKRQKVTRKSLEELAVEEGMKKKRPLKLEELKALRDRQVQERGSAPLGSELLIKDVEAKKKKKKVKVKKKGKK